MLFRLFGFKLYDRLKIMLRNLTMPKIAFILTVGLISTALVSLLLWFGLKMFLPHTPYWHTFMLMCYMEIYCAICSFGKGLLRRNKIGVAVLFVAGPLLLIVLVAYIIASGI
jgi:hypothetical protein